MNDRSHTKAMKGTLSKQTAKHDKVNDGLLSNNSNGQIQNVKAARVYVFGDADLDEEEILNGDVETCELRVRGKTKAGWRDDEPESSMVSIERPILEGETLQRIAVKYCCELADLKRINNLITDQDFHALTIIKVPVMKHGLVREKLEEELRQNMNDNGVGTENGSFVPIGARSSGNSHSVLQVTESNVSDSDWGDMDTNHDSESRELLVRTVSIGNVLTSQGEDAKNFLHRMDADIKNILSSTKSSKKRNLDEVRSSLTCRRIYPLERKEGFLGADCGMKIGTIVSIIVVVAIITPLVYFIYYEYINPSLHTTKEPGS